MIATQMKIYDLPFICHQSTIQNSRTESRRVRIRIYFRRDARHHFKSMTLKIRSRSSMMIFHIVTHINHISDLKGIDGYRKYVRIISMISTYKGQTFFDVILTTLEIISDYILIYRLRIVDNANISVDMFFPNSFDWRHWLDFWTGSFLSFWRTSMIRIRFDFIFHSFNDISLYVIIHLLLFSWTIFENLNSVEYSRISFRYLTSYDYDDFFSTNTCLIRSGTHHQYW